MPRIREIPFSHGGARPLGEGGPITVALAPGECPADYVLGLYGADGVQRLALTLDAPEISTTYDPQADEFLYLLPALDMSMFTPEPGSERPTGFDALALAQTGPGTDPIAFCEIGGDARQIVARDGIAAGARSESAALSAQSVGTAGGAHVGESDLAPLSRFADGAGDFGAICFCPGTQILTPRGLQPVERLRIGDRVLTRDSGAKAIAWIGRREVDGTGSLAPVEIGRGVLGAERPVRVSPQHRLLLCGADVSILTGETEALSPAIHLVDGQRLRRVPAARVTYLHLMFDRHEVIWADGLAAESFFLGPGSISAMTPTMRVEFEALFPGLMAGSRFGPLARPGLSRQEAALAVASRM